MHAHQDYSSTYPIVTAPEEKNIPYSILAKLLEIQNRIEGEQLDSQTTLTDQKKLKAPEVLAAEKLARTRLILNEQLIKFQEEVAALKKERDKVLFVHLKKLSQFINVPSIPCSCNNPNCSRNMRGRTIADPYMYTIFTSASNAAENLNRKINALLHTSENQTQEILEHYIQIVQGARTVITTTTPENITHLQKLATHRVDFTNHLNQYTPVDEKHKARKLAGTIYTLAGIAGILLSIGCYIAIAALVTTAPPLVISALVFGMCAGPFITVFSLERGPTLFSGIPKAPSKQMIENVLQQHEKAQKAEAYVATLR